MWLTAIAGAIKGAVAIGKGIAKAVKKAKKKPVVKVAAAALAGTGIAKVASGGVSQSLPVMTGGVPGAMALQSATTSQSPGGLPVPWYKGPGGKLQMPWSDPRIPEYLKQFALDDAYLKTYVRAPRGYVVVRDAQGRPFAVNKMIAKQFGIWKPKKKPPISVRDWQSFKRAKSVEKKLKKIAGPALRKHATRTCTTKKKR